MDEQCGIRDLLGGLEQFGWQPVEEGGNVIALKGVDGAVSLEPAGQLGTCRARRWKTCTRPARKPGGIWNRSRRSARNAAWAISASACGPTRPAKNCPSCPRAAYDIMLRHMPRVGSMGLDMMLRTCTIQV